MDNSLSENLQYLEDMYADDYYPNHLVDKIRNEIEKTAAFLEEGSHPADQVQAQLDQMTLAINDLEEEFGEAGSEIETIARDSIATTVEDLLEIYRIDIDIETALREREW